MKGDMVQLIGGVIISMSIVILGFGHVFFNFNLAYLAIAGLIDIFIGFIIMVIGQEIKFREYEKQVNEWLMRT